MTDVAFFIIIFGAVVGGGAAIEYHSSCHKPTRNALIGFRESLPKLLQWIYFNNSSAVVYDPRSSLSGIEYLLSNESSARGAFARWIACILLFVVPYFLILRVDFIEYGYIPIKSILYTLINVVVYSRIAFFGIKIEDPLTS